MKVGDLVYGKGGVVLGVLEEIYVDTFQVRIRGIGRVNYEDISGDDIRVIEEGPTTIKMYEVT